MIYMWISMFVMKISEVSPELMRRDTSVATEIPYPKGLQKFPSHSSPPLICPFLIAGILITPKL